MNVNEIDKKTNEARLSKDWKSVIDLKISDTKSRGAKKRGWIKITKSWLTSSMNYRMDLCEIAVFSKILVMADELGPVPGLISDNDFRPMPHDYLAHLACCELEIFEKTLKKCVDDDSIFENSHGIFVIHFDDYQFTEYDRQLPYRKAKKERDRDPGKYTDGPLGKLVARTQADVERIKAEK